MNIEEKNVKVEEYIKNLASSLNSRYPNIISDDALNRGMAMFRDADESYEEIITKIDLFMNEMVNNYFLWQQRIQENIGKMSTLPNEVVPIHFKGEVEPGIVRELNGETYVFAPNPNLGFNCGYSLFIPENCEPNASLIVYSCNTGDRDAIHLDDAIKTAINHTTRHVNNGMTLGYDLKMPVLIPLFPRIQGYYTQALGSRVFNNDISGLVEDQVRRDPENRLTATEIVGVQEVCRDMPKQLVGMIQSANQTLTELGYKVDSQVIAAGYSAGSRFANGFAILYPEMVKGLVCGGNSGLATLPLSSLNGQTLNFPLGVADIPNFNAEAYKAIPKLYYIGREDYNDSAMVKCNFIDGVRDDNYGGKKPVLDNQGNVIPLLDEKGQIQPRYRENFTQKEIIQIHTLLGANPQDRFDNSQRLYEQMGVNANFVKLAGNHNTVSRYRNGVNLAHNKEVEFIKHVATKNKTKPKMRVYAAPKPTNQGYINIWGLSLITIVVVLTIFLIMLSIIK